MPDAPLDQGTLGAGMAYLRLGRGRPLVVLPGLSADHRPPRGMDRRFQVQQIKPYASRRQVWWVNRRPGLPAGVTMPDLARDYADALRGRFDGPSDLLGISTGGSVALQLAADHPELVRRLVIASSAYRLGRRGRAAQRRAAGWLRAGRPRRAAASTMAVMGAGSPALMGALGWVLGKAVLGGGDPDLLAVLDAEDRFDLRDRLGEITARTLVVAGSRDACYGADLFRETAALIPRGELVLYPGKGHIGAQASRRLARDVLDFLER